MMPFEAKSARLMETATTLAAYTGGDANVALVRWVDALTEVYKDDLVTVSADELSALQAKVLQLAALRALAMGAVQTNGRT